MSLLLNISKKPKGHRQDNPNRLRVSMSQRGKPVSMCLLRIRGITMYILRQGLFKVGMNVKTTNTTKALVSF
jgi:hypothetical protein